MAIALGPVVVDDAVYFVGAEGVYILAEKLQLGLDLDNVVDLGEVHVALAEDKSFQVDDEDARQRVQLGLLRHITLLPTVVARQQLRIR